MLDKDHYGLEKVKERILEFLAVRMLSKSAKGPILCLVGPPGVGKTSLGQSIAEAMGRKFVRMSLGGVRDEAEIRGHRRTYIGALPGRIIQGMKKAGVRNPLFMLDEIDKMSTDFRGDPSSALLEVLDPAQNKSFSDHYLEIEFDLSEVFFIATANNEFDIPYALHDRMEVVRLSGYTMHEKEHIAKLFLLPRQKKECGLKQKDLEILPDGLDAIIQRYTREAGVRELERQIANICRKAARGVVENGRSKTALRVNAAKAFELLGPPPYGAIRAETESHIGVAIGMAWTQSGGDVLTIETTTMRGKGKLALTGQLGAVMKESAEAAHTYLRANAHTFGLGEDVFKNTDIHVHVPEGAIPKDGPSAGTALMTSMLSALKGIAPKAALSMTGEITLRGRVLPVGGIKEKVLAAHRAGIRFIILPKENEKDLPEVPEDVRKEIAFTLVEDVGPVLKLAFGDQLSALSLSASSLGGSSQAAPSDSADDDE
jgi:ATP-dependent Lon protease